MFIKVYLRDGRSVPIQNCTGDPTEVDVVVASGFYRDQFDLPAVITGLYFPGQNGATPADPADISVPVPGLMAGGIVPDGPVTIMQRSTAEDSNLNISSFKVAVSDEIAHNGLRQVQYLEGHWVFPVLEGGVSMGMKFRKVEVLGWGNVDDDD